MIDLTIFIHGNMNAHHKKIFLLFIVLLTLVILVQLVLKLSNTTESDPRFAYLPITSKDYTESSLAVFKMKHPIKYDDPELLAHINSTLQSPSRKQYNLHRTRDFNDPYNNYISTRVFKKRMRAVNHYFKYKNNGFFVEAGALDGESFSNTLDLEKDQGWTGLLVEPVEYIFNKLVKKNRKAWLSHSCLAIQTYPHEDSFKVPSDAELRSDAELMFTGLKKEELKVQLEDSTKVTYFERVMCYPVGSILLALNITKVDFFSLNIGDDSDVDTRIIDSFPFDKIQVDIWFIVNKPRGPQYHSPVTADDTELIKKFTSRGYTFRRYEDYIFIRKGIITSNITE